MSVVSVVEVEAFDAVTPDVRLGLYDNRVTLNLSIGDWSTSLIIEEDKTATPLVMVAEAIKDSLRSIVIADERLPVPADV